MNYLEDILICPKTRNRVFLDFENSSVQVKGTDVSYPINDGIIDFLPGLDDGISESYDSLSTQYDDYITSSNVKWKLVNLFSWGFAGADQYTRRVLSVIPEDFDGIVLDVPVGTGVLTFEKYKRLERARVIAIDYSFGMLLRAKQRYAEQGIRNVTLIRGDVGSLPIDDARVDFCLSMNGFHAFPEKDRALREIRRALRNKGRFIGCFYVRGKRRLTDFLIQTILSKRGAFTAPFYNETETLSLFGEHFDISSKGNRESIFYFDMGKK